MRTDTLVGGRVFRDWVLHDFCTVLQSCVISEELVQSEQGELKRFLYETGEIEAQFLHLGKVAEKCLLETRNQLLVWPLKSY